MLLPTVHVGSVLSLVFGIKMISWRMPEISPTIYTPFTRSSLLRSGISLAVDFWPMRAMVSANENVELTRPFSPEEVGKAIREMKVDSALGPDGLPVVFFQNFWEKI
jgi:hypothetical protein